MGLYSLQHVRKSAAVANSFFHPEKKPKCAYPRSGHQRSNCARLECACRFQTAAYSADLCQVSSNLIFVFDAAVNINLPATSASRSRIMTYYRPMFSSMTCHAYNIHYCNYLPPSSSPFLCWCPCPGCPWLFVVVFVAASNRPTSQEVRDALCVMSRRPAQHAPSPNLALDPSDCTFFCL